MDLAWARKLGARSFPRSLQLKRTETGDDCRDA